MTRLVSLSVAALLIFGVTGLAASQDDVAKHKSCKYCGMDREKFAHSRVLIEYGDGSSVGTCSIHCAALDLATSIDKIPASIRVGDYGTKKLVDAEKATWVIGGSKMGVMTKRAKWAFEDRSGAEAFTKENGGQLAGFDAALKATFEDMSDDVKMIRERRAAMRKEKMEKKH